MPRLATSTEFDDVLRLAVRKDYPTWPSQCPSDSGLAFLRGLQASDTWASEHDLLVTGSRDALSGYLVLQKQLVRGLTHDRESVIRDVFALQLEQHKKLLELAARTARSYESQYLTTEVSPGDKEQQDLLKSLGFVRESYRISVPTAECRFPEGSPYSIRDAVEGDDFQIAVLNSTMLHHTLSPGRDYDLGELSFRAMECMMAHVNRQDPQGVSLVLTLGEEMVGHLLLDINERFGYTYDLAVTREHWGGIAVRHLLRAGSRLLFRRNIPLFVGDVSASNRRARLVSERGLGFTTDFMRYGLKL